LRAQGTKLQRLNNIEFNELNVFLQRHMKRLKQKSTKEKDSSGEPKKEDVRETLKRTRSDIGISSIPSENSTKSSSPVIKTTGIRKRKNATKDAEEMQAFAKKTTEDMTQDEATYKSEVTEELLETTRRLKDSLEQTHEHLQDSNRALQRHSDLLDESLQGVNKQQKRLDKANTASCKNFTWSMILVLLTFVIFFGMYIFMKIIPKPS
jgi:uncharacterized protein YoxC